MQASVVTLEKPIQHNGLADWYAQLWENQQTSDTRRNAAYKLRHEARQLRNETRLKTNWDSYHNNVRLADRVTELQRWKELLEACVNRLEEEIQKLKMEKFETERDLDNLGIPLGVISECISMRDGRQGAELTYDESDTELKKELCVVENVKKMLMDRCQATWEKLNRLQEVKYRVQLDINEKCEAAEIDKDMLELDRNCANISFKLDSLRVPKDSIPYETWLEHSRYTLLLANAEMADTLKFRESLFVCRERGKNEIRAQRDCADFTLRKRIYETQRARNNIEWQLMKMREEMDKVKKELRVLQDSLGDKEDALKLCETRLETRTYRPGIEMARDESESGLKEEVLQLRQTIKDLQDKINCMKATYNALENQRVINDNDLNNKNQSLMTDIRCLDMRVRLRPEEPLSQIDRNIELCQMKDQIPPT